MSEHDKTRMISVDQLCLGLYVYMDMSWMDHSFPRNSFKLKSQDQIDEIRRLGMKNIRVNPRLCDGPPLPLTVAGLQAEVAAPIPATQESVASQAHKKDLMQQLSERQTAIGQCERQFTKSVSALKQISRNIFARPKESYEDTNVLLDQMLETYLTDANIATCLMSDRIGSEDMYLHAMNVTVLALMLGKRLELTPEQLKILGIGAMFHDLGKANVSDTITGKLDPLSKFEKNALQLHAELGAGLALKCEMPQEVIEIILQHHEAFDGSGYPKKLEGENISRLARIIAVVNTYDNLCNHINPLYSVSPYEALSIMFKQMRKTFDPAPFNMFIRCMGIYPPGTLVKLSDGTIGMVVGVDANSPMRPSVLIYDPGVPKSEAIVVELAREAELSVTSTLTAQQLPEEAYDYLSPKKRQVYFSYAAGPKAV